MIRKVEFWRIFRLANGWGACAFDPTCEELLIIKRVDSQEADDGETVPTSSIADLLLSQKGEAPQEVLRSCERGPARIQGPPTLAQAKVQWLEEA